MPLLDSPVYSHFELTGLDYAVGSCSSRITKDKKESLMAAVTAVAAEAGRPAGIGKAHFGI